MQEPKDDKDAELMKKFNDTLGCEIPPLPAATTGTGGATSSTAPAAAAAAGAGAAAAPPGSNAALQAQLLALLQSANLQGMQQRGPKVSYRLLEDASFLY